MGKLVPCKTCKHQVDQFAKLCPSCGVKNPGTKAYQGCLFFLMLVVVFFSLIKLNENAPDIEESQVNPANSMDQIKEPQAVSTPTPLLAEATKPDSDLKIPTLNDSNINDFLKSYANDYASFMMKLLNGFNQYKVNNDYHGYVLFKNNTWRPAFNERRHYYNAVWEANRNYLFSNNFMGILSQFDDLTLRAEEFFRDIRYGDKKIRKAATERLRQDVDNLEEVFKQRGLKFEVYFHE